VAFFQGPGGTIKGIGYVKEELSPEGDQDECKSSSKAFANRFSAGHQVPEEKPGRALSLAYLARRPKVAVVFQESSIPGWWSMGHRLIRPFSFLNVVTPPGYVS
jgi:hypothetical protein